MAGRIGILTVCVVAGSVLTGCSASSAGSTGFSIGRNLMRKDTNLKVYLDGREAVQSKLEKGLRGYASFKVGEPVTTSPVFRYELIDAQKAGTVERTSLQIHKEFDDDFSDVADYVVAPQTGVGFAPNTAYDLGALGADFTMFDRQNRPVERIELQPGLKYLLVFTVQADKSESLQVQFTTAE